MQISRHWRLNSQRYRLEGVRYQNGQVSLQNRPVVMDVRVQEVSPREEITTGEGVDGESMGAKNPQSRK